MSGSLPVWDPGRPGHELLDILKEEVRTKGKPNTARIHEIAELTGTTSAKVRGVIGYYSDLNTDDSTVHVCVGESCRARGSKSIITELENSGEVVGKIHCAGLCTNGPAVIRDNEEVIPISKDGDGLQFFLSMDSLSMSYGAESIAQSLLDQIPKDAALIRTGSRGLFHLEPMLEVLVNEKRIGFGPLDADETLSVVDSITNISHSSHPKYIGEVESLEEFSSQNRFATQRIGIADPLDIESMKKLGAYSGYSNAKNLGAEGVLSELKKSGLRGRGGAGFPTHFKWKAAADEKSSIKYVVANADEGDAGTFIDRMIMEGDPHLLIEGMLICAETTGANQGLVYLRSEYPQAKRILQSAIDSARESNILGAESGFDITIANGAGSYVCGEETALLESLEGRRGEVRARPPYPTTSGLYGQPTVVNNVLTFAIAAAILREGSELYSSLGTDSSRGTVVVQIVGATNRPACVEVPFGGTIGDVFANFSSLEGVKAVQIGGPLGSVFRAKELHDIELSFEGLDSAGGILGHGGFVAFGDEFDPHREVVEWMRFFRDESCGKCTPCRIGTQRALELLTRLGTENEKEGDRVLITDLDDIMTSTSLCALGGLAMNPVRSTIERWPSKFGGHLTPKGGVK